MTIPVDIHILWIVVSIVLSGPRLNGPYLGQCVTPLICWHRRLIPIVSYLSLLVHGFIVSIDCNYWEPSPTS